MIIELIFERLLDGEPVSKEPAYICAASLQPRCETACTVSWEDRIAFERSCSVGRFYGRAGLEQCERIADRESDGMDIVVTSALSLDPDQPFANEVRLRCVVLNGGPDS